MRARGPLQPGTYYVGVRANSGPAPLSYSLVSRGIGTNYAIAVSNLNFSGPGSTITNNIGLPAREAAYYRLVIPPNQPNWKVRLTPTSGDALLIVQRYKLPNVGAGGFRNGYGAKLQKLDREHYLVLPDDDQGLTLPETNFLAVVSEGVGASGSTIGAGVTTYRIESLGPQPVANLGTLAAAPGSSLSTHTTLEGGEVKLFRFTVAVGTAALEMRLNNRVGNPSFAVRLGTNSPYPHVPPPPQGDYYGAEGGYFEGRRDDFTFLTIANPAPGIYSVTVKAEDDAGFFPVVYPDAEADLVVTARGAVPLAFNNGTTTIAGQEPRAWRYFQVTVPATALGWDLRMESVTGGNPLMVVRRDLLPEYNLSDLYIYGDDWPSGAQLSASTADWTGRTQESDFSNRQGQILVVGRDNPLVPGNYIVGVYNSSPDQPAGYSLLSRGIGSGFAIGIKTLNFSAPGNGIFEQGRRS